MTTISRVLMTLAAASLAFACGDDGNANPDAAPAPDANVDAAPAPILKRGGTVAVFDAEVVNAAAAAVGVAGATVTVDFLDETTGNVAAEDLNGDGKPDSPVGGCAVTVIDVSAGSTDVEKTSTDEGIVSVTGTGAGDFACAFNAALKEYKCQSTNAAANGAVTLAGVVLDVATGTAVFDLGVDFATAGIDIQGMALVTTGFTADGTAGGGATEANGAFGIVGPGQTATQVVVVPTTELAAELAGGGTPGIVTAPPGTYSLLIGEGPVPAHPALGKYTDFLDDGTADVVINGPVGSTLVDQFSAFAQCPGGCTVKANGAQAGGAIMTLDTVAVGGVNRDKLDAFPSVAADFVLSCGASDGVCGKKDGGVLNAFVISGETTDAPLPAAQLDPLGIEMPDAVSRRVVFQCSAISSTSITIPSAAVALIIGSGATKTTRVQTQVTLSSGAIVSNANQEATTNIVVGHGLAGFTDITP